MANFSTIGINFDVFSNTSSLTFNFTNMTKTEFIDFIPANANTMTNDYYGIISLSVMAIFLLWLFTDQTQYGYFRYNLTRSLGITLGIISVMGIMMLSVGYMTNFIHLSSIMALYIVMLIFTVIYNPT